MTPLFNTPSFAQSGGILSAAGISKGFLLTGYVTGEVKLWSIKEKQLVVNLETSHAQQPKPPATCAGVSEGLCLVAFDNGM